jgi:Raf kinase inhibitor-like YbhB/YbcL family protein
MKRIAILVLVAACGGDSSPAKSDAPVDTPPIGFDGSDYDAPPGALTLTSPMLTEGGVIADTNSCAGTNVSPQLIWSAGPAAQSYAVVLTDKNNSLVHSVIYDIPGTAQGLPENVMKAYAPTNVTGAHQTTAYDNTTRGYLGPCPPAGTTHTYEFALYALDAATLPGTSMTTTRTQVVPLIMQHMLARTTLTGTFMRN